MKKIVLLVFLFIAFNAMSNVDGAGAPVKNETKECIESISSPVKVETESLENWIESRENWERNAELPSPIEANISLEDWIDSREIWEQNSEPKIDLLTDWIKSRESWEDQK